MPRGGQNKKPTLQVVREGNPGKRPVKDAVVLPPSDVREPDWTDYFPGEDAEVAAARAAAHELWDRVAETLQRSVGLVGQQQEALVDYCIAWARIRQGERALSRDGVIVRTERGQVKHGWTAPLNQYRAHFRALACELGLTPQAASKITRPESSDEDDPFD